MALGPPSPLTPDTPDRISRMSRKSTDLLDMFRGPAPAPPGKRGASGSSSSSSSSRGGGREIRVGARQVVLVASALVLSVVLAFVAGVATGRGRRVAPAETPAAVRLAATWYVDSLPLPLIDSAGKPLRDRAFGDLLQKYPQFSGRVEMVLPEDEVARKEGRFHIRITGFPDRSTAQQTVFELGAWQVAGGAFPFLSSRPRVAP